MSTVPSCVDDFLWLITTVNYVYFTFQYFTFNFILYHNNCSDVVISSWNEPNISYNENRGIIWLQQFPIDSTSLIVYGPVAINILPTIMMLLLATSAAANFIISYHSHSLYALDIPFVVYACTDAYQLNRDGVQLNRCAREWSIKRFASSKKWIPKNLPLLYFYKQMWRYHDRHHHNRYVLHNRRHRRDYRCVRAPVDGSVTCAGRNDGFFVKVVRGSMVKQLPRLSASTGCTGILWI